MGGHAFPNLNCPRIPSDLYFKIRDDATGALCKVFTHVVVPTEMPSKTDYGDIDFLVSGFISTLSSSPPDWSAMVKAIKQVFGTPYGRQGYYERDVGYFAIPAHSRGEDEKFWVQVDVKVCVTSGDRQFEWTRFQLNYASASKMLGSMLKPLGLTISPEGMYLRVEEMETTDLTGSMVFVGQDAKDVLKIVGLDWRILWHMFETRDEIYEYLTSSWIFNPAHFAERLKDQKYIKQLEDRSAPWVHFVKEWMLEHYPSYQLPNDQTSLGQWYKQTRVAIRERVFMLDPHIATKYFTKRNTYLKEVEENRVRELLMNAIPACEKAWNDSSLPPLTTVLCAINPTNQIAHDDPLLAPLSLPTLSRDPPVPFAFHSPPLTMSLAAKMVCIARWTHFSPTTGYPYLGSEPREKKFKMYWSDSVMSDDALMQWVQKVWKAVWWRQSRKNYVGMWRSRFEKEDDKAVTKTLEKGTGTDKVKMVNLEKTANVLEGRHAQESRLVRNVLLDKTDSTLLEPANGLDPKD